MKHPLRYAKIRFIAFSSAVKELFHQTDLIRLGSRQPNIHGTRITGALLVLPVAFNLWVLRAQLTVAQNLNDNVMHLQMIRWAQNQIQQGKIPLDGWYPYFGLGTAHFHHYQAFPHILSAYLSQIFGTDVTFRWILYLLLSLWPVCVFVTARLLRIEKGAAVAAAIVAPLLVSTPGHGYEHGSYVWHGYGVWAQLWAMWLLPLSWALSWRAVSERTSYVAPAVALAATIVCHFLTGYLALLSVCLWVLLKPSEFLARAKHGLVVLAGSLALSAWVIVPTALDAKWATRSAFHRGTFYNDSFGAEKVLGWLFTGQIYDSQRVAAITVLVAAGLIRCVRGWSHEPFRAVASVWVLSLLLFFGRPTLGPLLNLLPFSDDLLLHRFIIGLHMAGIFLAGIGAAWLGKLALDRARSVRLKWVPSAAAGIVAGLLIVAPASIERASYGAKGGRLISEQRLHDRTDGADLAALIDKAKQFGDGRIYAGMRSNWGQQYRTGSVPVFAALANRDADAIGFTLRTVSLSSDVEAWFDDTRPGHYDLFNVKYLLLPEDREPPVPAALLEKRGRHVLWRVETSGYLSVIDTASSIAADRSNLSKNVRAFLLSTFHERKLHPAIAFAGEAAAPGTLNLEELNPIGEPGQVLTQGNRANEGLYFADVVAGRPSVALLKASYHPRWSVLVDGRRESPQMIAPSFVGVRIPPGRHRIDFRYVAFGLYPLLLALAVAAIGTLVLVQNYRLPFTREMR